MRISISNIAWDVPQDEAVAGLLRRHGVDAIDIAPGKYFPNPQEASRDDTARVRGWWEERGVQIIGMQALLFGTSGLNVFGGASSQNAMLDHLSAVCRIAGQLGATRLVFGSPKNRDRSGLDDAQALAIATPFFRRLGDVAEGHGVAVCLEPNPTCYGANFMTTSADTAAVVESVAHPAIRMQLDTGAITLNQESIEDVLGYSAHLIGHIHASEPELAPLGDRATDHRALHAALAAALPQHPVTIEMVATRDEAQVVSVERALACAIRNYRP